MALDFNERGYAEAMKRREFLSSKLDVRGDAYWNLMALPLEERIVEEDRLLADRARRGWAK